jgi:hypothetical protein
MLKKTKEAIADAGRTVSTVAVVAVAALVVAVVALAVALLGGRNG